MMNYTAVRTEGPSTGETVAGRPSALTPEHTLGAESTGTTGTAVEVVRALRDKLAWWGATSGTAVPTAGLDAASLTPFLDPTKSPVPGVALTTVPARDQLWKQLQPEQWKPAMVASMVMYRAQGTGSGVFEMNPTALPPVEFLVGVLKDDRTDADTRQIAYMILEQASKTGHLPGGQRSDLVRQIGTDAANEQLRPLAEKVMASFNIKPEEVRSHRSAATAA